MERTAMNTDPVKMKVRREVAERLTQARRDLRDEEQRLAQLKYEWGIAKRLRDKAGSEEDREKWRVQSDVYMGMVLQQENVIEVAQQQIAVHKAMLIEVDSDLSIEESS